MCGAKKHHRLSLISLFCIVCVSSAYAAFGVCPADKKGKKGGLRGWGQKEEEKKGRGGAPICPPTGGQGGSPTKRRVGGAPVGGKKGSKFFFFWGQNEKKKGVEEKTKKPKPPHSQNTVPGGTHAPRGTTMMLSETTKPRSARVVGLHDAGRVGEGGVCADARVAVDDDTAQRRPRPDARHSDTVLRRRIPRARVHEGVGTQEDTVFEGRAAPDVRPVAQHTARERGTRHDAAFAQQRVGDAGRVHAGGGEGGAPRGRGDKNSRERSRRVDSRQLESRLIILAQGRNFTPPAVVMQGVDRPCRRVGRRG